MRTLIFLLLLFPLSLSAQMNGDHPIPPEVFEALIIGQWEADIEGVPGIALMHFKGLDSSCNCRVYVIEYIDQRLGEQIIWSRGLWEMRKVPVQDPTFYSVTNQIADGILPKWNFCLIPLTEAGNRKPSVCTWASYLGSYSQGDSTLTVWMWSGFFTAFPRGEAHYCRVSPYSNC